MILPIRSRHVLTAAIVTALVAATTPAADANTPRVSARAPAKSTAKPAPRAPRPDAAAASRPLRADVPVVVAQGSGADQAGYIHYFVITGPDGQPINHVGIELPGERIVSS